MSDSMRKIHQWTCTPTGYVEPEFGSPEKLLKLEEESTDTGFGSGFSVIKEYIWRVRFGVTFRCNEAEYEYAKENAAAVLVHEIYGPIEQLARKAMSASFSRDHESTVKSIGEILDLVQGKGER